METAAAVLLFIVGSVFALGLVRYVVGANQMADYGPAMFWPSIIVTSVIVIGCFAAGIALL
jgi:hypothetical protein